MKAVFFDLWNTLIRPGSKKFTDCMAEAMNIEADYVLDYLRASSSRHSDVHYKRIVHEIWGYRHGKGISRATMKKVEVAHDQFVQSAEFIEGAVELLAGLRHQGLHVSIVSNATSVSATVVDRLGVRSMVDEVFLSCQTGYLKPDPRAFLKAAEGKAFQPNQCCVIGDKLTTDILGAKLASMPAIWFSPDVQVVRDELCVDLVAIVNALPQVREYIGKP